MTSRVKLTTVFIATDFVPQSLVYCDMSYKNYKWISTEQVCRGIPQSTEQVCREIPQGEKEFGHWGIPFLTKKKEFLEE